MVDNNNLNEMFANVNKMMEGTTERLKAAMDLLPREAPKFAKINGKDCSITINKMNHIILEFKEPQDAQDYYDNLNK